MNSTCRLNAPFGARCFLTHLHNLYRYVRYVGLNAPFGARCFLTLKQLPGWFGPMPEVLIHRLALGAF